MEPNKTSRQIQYLATVLALVSTYYAVRATLVLPGFYQMFMTGDVGDRLYSVGWLILEHHYWFLALVVATSIMTLSAIWKSFKYHELAVPLGIGLQFFLAERAVASVVDPMIRMISVMGSQ